jgi:hypothetical protein
MVPGIGRPGKSSLEEDPRLSSDEYVLDVSATGKALGMRQMEDWGRFRGLGSGAEWLR